MSRTRRLTIGLLVIVILVLCAYQISVRRRADSDLETMRIPMNVTPKWDPESGLTYRQWAFRRYGEAFFRPCTVYWTPPNPDQFKESPRPERHGSVQAYMVYVDDVWQARIDKNSKLEWLINLEGKEVSVRSANSKGESSEVKMDIPMNCLPLPKMP